MSEIDYDDSWPYPDDDSDRWEELVDEAYEEAYTSYIEDDSAYDRWANGPYGDEW